MTAKSPPDRPPGYLREDDLRTVVRLAPLVAIDLIIRNAANEVLLGLRNNAPAQNFWFVPGGMIVKNERLRDAFARILRAETNLAVSFDEARLLGAFEHFYDENRFGAAGYGTHYVVLGYTFTVADAAALAADDQHSRMRWWDERALIASPDVHDNTKAYITSGP